VNIDPKHLTLAVEVGDALRTAPDRALYVALASFDGAVLTELRRRLERATEIRTEKAAR
jgi:hypothetical protein